MELDKNRFNYVDKKDPFNKDNLAFCKHPGDLWDRKILRGILHEETCTWITDLRAWSTFLTLTFKNDVPADVAIKKWRWLVRSLNEGVFGKHYTKIVKHSYFSYVLGIEYQSRNVIHFHVLIDQPINYARTHVLWNKLAGFAWTESITDRAKVVRYVTKYITKGGEILPYLAKKLYVPKYKPDWWLE